MYSLAIDQKADTLRILVEGCSIRSTERLTGHHRDTIMRLSILMIGNWLMVTGYW
jgi:hypothetical protein